MTVTYQLSFISGGRSGVRATLAAMSKIVKQYKKTREIRELALSIVANVPAKNWLAEVNAIYQFVKHNIRYVKDIKGVETLHSPIQLLRLRQGDCDDMSILSACLLEALGHPTRFCAVGINGGNFSHVFAQTKVAGKWVTLECTMANFALGQSPKKISCLMMHHN